MTQFCRRAGLLALAFGVLLAGTAFAAEKLVERPNTAADVVQPSDRVAAPTRPSVPVPGPNGSRIGAGLATVPIDYDSPADFAEGFDDINLLPGLGWFFQNNSNPLGLTNWFQGNDTVFPAQAGAPTAYIGANFNNTAGVGTISNWMLTPEVPLVDGDTVSFWTRTVDSPRSRTACRCA